VTKGDILGMHVILAIISVMFSFILYNGLLVCIVVVSVFPWFLVSRQSSVVMDTHSVITPVCYLVIITEYLRPHYRPLFSW